ncbi:MAG: DUF992 domain-containing protein [Pseudomonadota bacterium]
MHMSRLSVAAAALALLASPSLAQSGEARVEVGELRCELTDRTNLVLVSRTTFACAFNRNAQPTEAYTAEVTAVGIDLEMKSSEVIRWLVLAPTNAKDDAGILEGDYGGVSASASLGVGVGANALVGGFDKSIALNPLSVSGSEGIGAALGVEGMALTLAD